jgi:hypothetical protein
VQTKRRSSFPLFFLLTFFLLSLSLFLSPRPALAQQATTTDQAATTAAWLIDTHQNSDGGYSSFSDGADLAPSDPGGTLDAVLALAAADSVPAATLAWLQQHNADLAEYAGQDGGNAGKLLLVQRATALDLPADIAARLTAAMAQDGTLNTATTLNQAWALLGLAAADRELPAAAVAWLVGQQAEDGSWDDGFGTLGNVDTTALALMALVAAGSAPDALTGAITFLRTAQQPDGGWEYGSGFGTNANSTALALQALLAAGEAVETAWAVDGISPLAALQRFRGDNGAFRVDFGGGPADNFFATVQALPALAGQSYPLPSTTLATLPTPEPASEAAPTPEPSPTPVPEPSRTEADSRIGLLLVGLLVVAGVVVALAFQAARSRRV